MLASQISGIRAVEASGLCRVGTLGDTCSCCYIMHWAHACRRFLEGVLKALRASWKVSPCHVPKQSRPVAEGRSA